MLDESGAERTGRTVPTPNETKHPAPGRAR
jgi:hypothetical protein